MLVTPGLPTKRVYFSWLALRQIDFTASLPEHPATSESIHPAQKYENERTPCQESHPQP